MLIRNHYDILVEVRYCISSSHIYERLPKVIAEDKIVRSLPQKYVSKAIYYF